VTTDQIAAAAVQTFLLPDVGEGLTEADIVAWHVAVGDTVAVNQIIVDIETAKSVVELPCPFAGEIVELMAAEGDTVEVGKPIIGVRTSDAPVAPVASDTDEPKLLVGYGASETAQSHRRRGPVPARTVSDEVGETLTPQRGKPRAKPPVRKLAKVLGVDLGVVTGTGPDSTIVREDVLRNSQEPTGEDASTDEESHQQPIGASATESTRIPIKGVRKHTAAAMVSSAFTAPHVTEFVTIDVTRTLELRETVQRRRDFRDIKLTPLAFIARAYVLALARTPMANARWDDASQEIVVPAGTNLGIAAATPRGLMVPNIKGAHALSLAQLATAINELAATARAGKTPPEDMADGTTTITNVGVFGVDTGTPILNPGETAILAVGAIRRQPWVVEHAGEERMEIRSVLQLALSFDHRVLDGAEGSQVLTDTAAVLAEPGLAVL
jgi:2-oxoisovalerate dehydrogenase E2 component (dihydrolipoyl transacylase)